MTFSPFVEKIAKQIKVSKAFDLLLQPACRYIWLLMWLWTINALYYNKQRQCARKNKWNKILHLKKCFFLTRIIDCLGPFKNQNLNGRRYCRVTIHKYIIRHTYLGYYGHYSTNRSWKNIIMMIWMQKHSKNCTFLSFRSI